MIFVAVGTHYLPFDRLLRRIALLIETQTIREKVVIQSGTSTFLVPKAKQKPYFDFDQFNNLLRSARIIICHAGPASIYQSLSFGKKPIVVPRLKKYGEHVSDHQLSFTKELAKEGKIYFAASHQKLVNLLQTYRSEPTQPPVKNILAKRLLDHINSLTHG